MDRSISKKEKEELITEISSFLTNAEPEYKYDLGNRIAYLFYSDPDYIVMVQKSKEIVFGSAWPKTILVEIETGTSRDDFYAVLESLANVEREVKEATESEA